ncbi:FkbM family methyltransferase [bacterium]|nr:FkbM family methyltransferase [bacterium]
MWKRARRWLSRWTGSYPLALNGQTYYCDAAHAKFWYQLDQGRWEPETLQILDTMLTPDSCYWDVGAWIGPTALYASGLCRQVIAFEPDPFAFRVLQRNINGNHLENVQLQPAAVGATSGELKLAPPQGSNLGSSVTSVLFADRVTKDFVTAEVHHPATWIHEHHLPVPDAMKIDIEGAEFDLIPALGEFFEEYRPRVYLSLHAPWKQEPLVALQSLLPALELFPYCYDSQLNLVNSSDFLTGNRAAREFTSLVLSFDPLVPIPQPAACSLRSAA